MSDLPCRFQPRLHLQTLTRGDGVLGLRPGGLFGPRGGNVTVASIDWTYQVAHGLTWETPAPVTLMTVAPAASQELQDEHGQRWLIQRDLAAEAAALELILSHGMHALHEGAIQWRGVALSNLPASLWSLVQEEHFSDFWADVVPLLQQQGWRIVVSPGFAHESVNVDAWRLIVSPVSGEVLGKEPASAIPQQAVRQLANLGGLRAAGRGAGWLITLGVEIEGERCDLLPMLTDLMRRDARWLDLQKIAQIDAKAVISLRMPGGRRVNAPATTLKLIMSAMLDLLTDPRRKQGVLKASAWDACRIDELGQQLADGTSLGAWRYLPDTGLRSLAQRLRAAGTPPSIAPPNGLGIQLRAYQLHGVAWLQYLRAQGLGGILADDMGLGKTAQVLAHILLEKQAGRLDCPALVVLPTSLVFNWQAEAQRIAPGLRVLALQGEQRHHDFARMAQYDLILTTYALVWRDLDALLSQSFHLLILDEAQITKNPTAQAARAVRRLRARHRLCMTGTPLENHLGELWSQFHFLMPGFLGEARSFTRWWRKPIEENGDLARAQLLAARVRPFLLRRRKAEVATELPPRTDAIKLLRFEAGQRDLYESVRVAADKQVRELLKRRGVNTTQISIMDVLLKLRQVCCDPRLLRAEERVTSIVPVESAKIAMLRDMLPALLEQGRRVLVFSQFTSMLSLIAVELDDLQLPYSSLTGAVQASRRAEVVRAFQDGEVALMLVSLKAGGVGLNLTAADTVILVDPWWNPAVEEQAIARAHRIGQQQPVVVYKLIIEGSIEERIQHLQQRKAVLAEGILGSDAGLAPKFGEAELADLLSPLRVG
ncbi:superfamily II DNA or RNA helicase [Herbaspirillum sp. Sphag1AN]|uniref:DEAD/DEAH box helicase n=1 Tax=unclassified Herbaspirillum TaxID=2624150 RepID=UPI00180C8D23|nr:MULTISPECIES: DEAD/DEAH box helicase [unclassified Herbaspirillum]MBB3214108.1 superfamily II DNA or RNA helicase [Herbaspirillum sp. Sphag1AN]MBB3247805.1 superfamily II DNA or RNA helicase [Herbaspirillum sp. Sphag64]